MVEGLIFAPDQTKTARGNIMENVNREYIRALKLKAKLAKLANMKASYKFRLAAMAAADNRPGKVWA